MIVYVKPSSGQIYASPVFAEIGKGWGIKSVVLNESGDALILMPLLERQGGTLAHYNYFYIDESLQDGWINGGKIRGFAEIIKNKPMLKALKHGKEVPTAGIGAVKRYELPLPVITEFEIKTESDKAIFNTVCWGLHDAHIEKVETVDNDMIIKFDTSWEKHVTVSFHNVYAATGLESVACILDSSFKIEQDRIKWEVIGGYDLSWDGLDEGSVSVTAKSVSWQLTID